MKILYAEDDGVLRKILELSLKRRGHEVDAVENGEELFKRLGAGDGYDVVVTDNDMPLATGLQVLAQIREMMGAKTLPVIVLTGDGFVESRVQELGGIFLHKGGAPKNLYTELERLQSLASV